jgi:hypothetical protein
MLTLQTNVNKYSHRTVQSNVDHLCSRFLPSYKQERHCKDENGGWYNSPEKRRPKQKGGLSAKYLHGIKSFDLQ